VLGSFVGDGGVGDADRSGDAVRSEEAAVGFDLSACAASRWIGTGSDNVKMEEDIVEMIMVVTDSFVVDADRSGDAVRSGETDLSAFAEPDNVKILDDNVKMKMDDNVKKRKSRMNYLTTNFK